MNKTITLTMSLLISGCMQVDDPKDVAQQYWQAMQSGDTEKARILVSNSSRAEFDRYVNQDETKRIPLNTVALTESRTVVTTIINTNDSSEKLDTVLVIQNGRWVIDADATKIPAPAGITEHELNTMTNRLSDSLNKSLGQMEAVIGEGMEMLNELLQDSSEELSESVDKSVKNMTESMREATEKLKQRRQQQSPTPRPGKDADVI